MNIEETKECIKVMQALLTKLLEYIDAAIDVQFAKRDYIDGGLSEARVKYRVRDELFELINKEEAK